MNMNTQQLIITAIVGIVAGWLASIFVGGPSSLLGYLITGLIGAFVGNFVLGAVGWKPNARQRPGRLHHHLGDRRDHRRHPGQADHLRLTDGLSSRNCAQRVSGTRDVMP